MDTTMDTTMKASCTQCKHDFAVLRFGTERLWRIVCPGCGHTMWVSAPIEESPRSRAAGGAPGSRSSLGPVWR